ncbi:MAG TPA: ABC-2 family transporter protein [Chloroflexota bacterium]|jgi:ABC-2 type transport system permease protein|nr:ABC-2 family transporter protein [Chloroflexota bacterium]
MVKGVRLLWLFVRLGVLHELAYRTHLVVQLLASAMSLGASLALLAAVFAHTDTVAGWSPPELLAVLGVYYLLGGLLGTVVQPSLQRLMEDVRHGTLDFTLLKPLDPQVLVSIGQVHIWKLVDAALGAGLLGVAMLQLGAGVGLWQAVAFGVALLAGCAIAYSTCLLLATLTFWFVRVDNALLFFLTMWEAGRWPVALYPRWLQVTLTVLVPVAFATTVPAEILAGRLTPAALGGAVAVALALAAGSRWCWMRGLRRYAGASG